MSWFIASSHIQTRCRWNTTSLCALNCTTTLLTLHCSTGRKPMKFVCFLFLIAKTVKDKYFGRMRVLAPINIYFTHRKLALQ